MNGDTGSYEILTAALGLLTATHSDSRMAGPLTVDSGFGSTPIGYSRACLVAADWLLKFVPPQGWPIQMVLDPAAG